MSRSEGRPAVAEARTGDGPGGTPWTLVGIVIVVAAVGLGGWILATYGSRSVRADLPLLGQPTRPMLTLRASSSADGYPPQLAMDGRTHRDASAYWVADPEDDAPTLTLDYERPVSILGVELAKDDDAAFVRVTLNRQALSRVNANASYVALDPSIPVRSLTFDFDAQRGLREVRPIMKGSRVWLLGGDWTREILTGYGLRQLAGPSLSPGFEDADVVLLDRPLSTTRPDEETPSEHDAVWAVLARGGVVVELDPTVGFCGGTLESEPAVQSAVISGTHLGPAVRWPGAVFAEREPCVDTVCREATGTLTTLEAENDGTRTPLVLARSVGDGACYRWMSPFATTLARLRQGDPARAGEDVDGNGEVQPADLLVDDLVEPLRDLGRPAADLLVFELLAQVARAPGRDVFLRPMPDALAEPLIYTVDQDYAPDVMVKKQLDDLSERGAHATVLATEATVGGKPDVTYPGGAPRLSSDTVDELVAAGHRFGVHPNVAGVQQDSLVDTFTAHTVRHGEALSARPTSVRNHHVLWNGYARMARLQSAAGLNVNLDYMSLARSDRGGTLGWLGGSSVPLRFVTEDGEVLPIFQQTTQLDDHVLLPARFGYTALSVEQLNALSTERMQVAEKLDVPIVVNHHPTWWVETDGAWQQHLTAEAGRLEMPIVSVESYLAQVLAMRDSLVWEDQHGSLRVHVAGLGATLMVEGDDEIRLDDELAKPVRTVSRAGVTYGLFALTPGLHTVGFADDKRAARSP